MPAPKGNKYWEARASSGREKIFDSPETLWESCVEYFNWVEENPLLEEKVFHSQGEITRATISKMRAMTLGGLHVFLDIDQNTWARYRKGEAYKDFWEIVRKVDQIIRDQKFTGAAADLLNANIIARDLGLSEKTQHDVSDRLASLLDSIDGSDTGLPDGDT